MSGIPTWTERCEKHPDHQQGMVTHGMIAQRMQEEIDELRGALTKALDALQDADALLDAAQLAGRLPFLEHVRKWRERHTATIKTAWGAT